MIAGIDVPTSVEVQNRRGAIAPHVDGLAEVDEQQEQIRQVAQPV